MSNRSGRRPHPGIAYASAILGLAAIPVPGLLGAALGIAAVVLGATFITLYVRATR